MGITATILTTALFFSLALFYGIYRGIRFLLNMLFYVPLRLFSISFEAFRNGYAVLLRSSLRFAVIFLLLVVLVTVHAGFLAVQLGRELMPPMRQGEFGLRMEIQAGARLEETEVRARRFEEIIRQVPEVDSVTVEIGEEEQSSGNDRGENVAEFTVLLRNPNETALQQDAVIEALRRRILEAARDEIITFSMPTLFSFRSAIETQIVGDTLPDLRRLGQEAVVEISTILGVKDAELSVKPGYPELIIEMDRNLLAARGLSPGQVAQRLRSEIQGEVATRFSRGADKIDIRVRADQNILRGVDDLRNLSVVDGRPPSPGRRC